MKILLVSLFLPQKQAKHAGGRYVFELLSRLAERHEVHLATRLEEEELPSLELLRQYCKEIHPYTYRTVANRGPIDNLKLIANYLGFSRYADNLIQNGEFDMVQVEWVETALLIGRGRGPGRTPMVLDAHDVITKPAERRALNASGPAKWIAGLRYRLVKAVERTVMKRFDAILTVSEYDRDYLLKMAPGLPVRTVPIPAGLDITERRYAPRAHTILFVASFKYRRVNVEAALHFYHQIFPRVRARVPEARFVIAGYGPPDELTALAAADEAVEVTGFVDDLDRCYKEAAVFVAPILTGGGIIVKILDALAAGRPVVTTTYGNEGIGAEPGRDLLVADAPEPFADAVVGLLTDPARALELGERGREFVRTHYSLGAVMGRIESCYAEIAAARLAG